MPQSENRFTKEKSQLFKTLLAQAQRKGYIQVETIKSRFARYNTSEDELIDYLQKFNDSGVNVVYADPSECEEEPSTDDGTVSDSTVPMSDFESSSDADSIQLYLNEIHKYPTLSHKETLALVQKAKDGDAAAREFLINCNLKFAFSIAVKYMYNGAQLFDIVQQANIGLTKAVDKYNPHRGTRFTSYAIFWIKQSIIEYINNVNRLISLPQYIYVQITQLRKLEDAFCAKHHRKPTDDELATLSELPIAKVKRLKAHDIRIISTDAPIDDEQDTTIEDTLTDFDIAEDPHKEFFRQECHAMLQDLIGRLTPKQRDVIILRYGLDPNIAPYPLSLDETGKMLGISKERVRQLETIALNRLREMPGTYALRAYLVL